MLTTTKAQFRRNIKMAAMPVKPKRQVDPNAPLTITQLRRLYEAPGRLLEEITEVRERLQNHGTARGLARIRVLKEQYLEAQTALALAYKKPENSRMLLKIRLQDASR